MQDQQRAVANIRSFNRFYTQFLGLLNRHILDSDFSLTEARVLLEISREASCQANELADRLQIDRSFLSRILKRLESRELIGRTASPCDARASLIRLQPAGQEVLTELDGRSDRQIGSLIASLTPAELSSVQSAMRVIRDKLSPALHPVQIRGYAQGDEAYVIRRHAELYAREYGLDAAFAAMVDGLVTRFVQTLDPACECLLIPETDGRRMGSVAIARADADTAQLRFFLLEPEARGLGLGLRLAESALAFARGAGYRHVFLETISLLTSARAIYTRLGFSVTHTRPQQDWGREVLEERWEMDL